MYIKIIYRVIFDKLEFENISYKPKRIIDYTYWTIDLRYDLKIQCVQSLNTGHAHVQIAGLYLEGNRGLHIFPMVEGKLHEDQINAIQKATRFTVFQDAISCYQFLQMISIFIQGLFSGSFRYVRKIRIVILFKYRFIGKYTGSEVWLWIKIPHISYMIHIPVMITQTF